MNVAVFLSHFFSSRIKCSHCSKMDLRVEVFADCNSKGFVPNIRKQGERFFFSFFVK